MTSPLFLVRPDEGGAILIEQITDEAEVTG